MEILKQITQQLCSLVVIFASICASITISFPTHQIPQVELRKKLQLALKKMKNWQLGIIMASVFSQSVLSLLQFCPAKTINTIFSILIISLLILNVFLFCFSLNRLNSLLRKKNTLENTCFLTQESLSPKCPLPEIDKQDKV